MPFFCQKMAKKILDKPYKVQRGLLRWDFSLKIHVCEPTAKRISKISFCAPQFDKNMIFDDFIKNHAESSLFL